MNFSTSLRIILFFVFLGFFTVSFQIGTSTVLDEEESLAIFNEFNQTITDIDSMGIFLNNLTIALPTFIPALGYLWMIRFHRIKHMIRCEHFAHILEYSICNISQRMS